MNVARISLWNVSGYVPNPDGDGRVALDALLGRKRDGNGDDVSLDVIYYPDDSEVEISVNVSVPGRAEDVCFLALSLSAKDFGQAVDALQAVMKIKAAG